MKLAYPQYDGYAYYQEKAAFVNWFQENLDYSTWLTSHEFLHLYLKRIGWSKYSIAYKLKHNYEVETRILIEGYTVQKMPEKA